MQDINDQTDTIETVQNVTAITIFGQTPQILTRPPVEFHQNIYNNIDPKLGSKTFESLHSDIFPQASRKFLTLPNRSSAKRALELSPDSPSSRRHEAEPRDLHPSVLLAEHIYSVPQKGNADSSRNSHHFGIYKVTTILIIISESLSSLPT